MASSSKQRRIASTVDDSINLHSFDVNSKRSVKLGTALNAYLLAPSSISVTVRPLRIRNCNAADLCGVSFSEAYCSVETNKEAALIVDIFRRGIELIVGFLRNELPSVRHEKFILCKLLKFIHDEEEKHSFQNINELTETELTTMLANHLFGKLSTSDDFIIDESCQGKGKESNKRCPCGKEHCKLTGSFGDTSIGNCKVWHGIVDIIVGNNVGVTPIEDNPDGTDGKSKLKSTNLSSLSPVIAETIVFSFLQKTKHPENDHFLTPFIGVGSSEMVILFYDAEYDILLQSSPIPLMESVGDGVSKLSLQAILVSWMVVNYKYLCSGLTEGMKSFMKADFFNQARMKINIYENNLKFQNVDKSASSENLMVEDDLQIEESEVAKKLYKDVADYLCSKRK